MGTRRDSPTRLARLGRLTNDPKSAEARVFVGNISPQTASEQELRDLFSQYGEVIGLSMHNNGKYAFVQFSAQDQAHNAISGAMGHTMGGKRIDVRPAVDKKSSAPRSGSQGGGYSRPPPRYSERPPPPHSSSSSHSLTPGDFRLFDVGQMSGGRSSSPAPAAHESSAPPDYSGAAGARYAPPAHPQSSSAVAPASGQAVPPETAADQSHSHAPPHHAPPPPARSPPRPVEERHHGRSRSPHWPERPASPPRYERRERSRSPGWYRYEEERRRYEYELARWEDEERYRRWYYENYGEPRYSDRHDPYYRDHYSYERGRERASRHDDYWQRQDSRHPEHYHDSRHAPEHYRSEHHHPGQAGAAPGPARPPPRPQHNELFEKERAAAAPAPASQPQRPPLDSLVLMVHKQQQGYANMISHRLKEAGMLSETREMPGTASLPDIIAAGIKRKLLFLFVVTSENELHRSLSVHILHMSPVQEHKNMPFDDALDLVKRNFEEYCADVRAGRVPSRLAPVQPKPGVAAPAGSVGSSNGTASARPADGPVPAGPPQPSGANAAAADISTEQLSSLISTLREKQQQQQQAAPGSADGAGTAPAQQSIPPVEIKEEPTQPAASGEAKKFSWT
ncbi:nuclear receptor coactivator 5-like [Sycon ciliatum]|uniref:nuclear receptor coactivator 5-like n=1 Tax=Sycon ciliatum TaxID=27933 RepID=UPI0031F6583F